MPGRSHAHADTFASRSRPSWLSTILAVVVAGSVLAVGAVHLPLLVVVAAIVTAGAFFGPRLHVRARMPAPVWVAIGLAIYTLLQTVPLPMALLAFLAPANADVWVHAAPGAAPRFATISLDPGASSVEALKCLIYGGVFALAARVTQSRGAAQVYVIVFTSAVAAAAVTIAHGLLDATKVWGIYQPSFAQSRWHIGPLLNPNNLSGYLNLGAFVGVGLVLTRRPPIPRWLLGVGLTLLVATEVIAASRGGILALLVGLVVLAVWLRFRRRAGTWNWQAAALVGAAVAGGCLLALLGGDAGLRKEIYDKNVDKLAMIAWVVPLVREHPWFGIGRGAFESVFPAYRSQSGNLIYTHAENLPVQWIAEWGLLALVGMAALVLSLKPWTWRSAERSPSAAAAIGIGALLLQNMVDLGLEIPAISIGLAAVLGAQWADARSDAARSRKSDRGSEATPSERSRAPWRHVLPVATASIALLAAIRGGPGVADDRADLHDQFAALDFERRDDVSRLRERIVAMIHRHPAEPYFPLVGATIAYATGVEDPLPWLERTLERAHSNGRAHLLLAEVLAARHAEAQVMLELRLATSDEPPLAPAAAEFALRTTTDARRIVEAVPEGKTGLPMLESLSQGATQRGAVDLAAHLDSIVLARDPGEPGAHARAARRLVAAVTNKKQPCEHATPCDVEFERHVVALTERWPARSTAVVVRAEMLAARGDPRAADQLLRRECPRFDDRVVCIGARATIAAGLSESEPLALATRDLLATACTDGAECGAASAFAADLRGRRGDWVTSAALYARAVRESPNEERYRLLGAAASRAGLHAQAADAFEHAGTLHGKPDPELARRVQEERASAHPILVAP